MWLLLFCCYLGHLLGELVLHQSKDTDVLAERYQLLYRGWGNSGGRFFWLQSNCTVDLWERKGKGDERLERCMNNESISIDPHRGKERGKNLREQESCRETQSAVKYQSGSQCCWRGTHNQVSGTSWHWKWPSGSWDLVYVWSRMSIGTRLLIALYRVRCVWFLRFLTFLNQSALFQSSLVHEQGSASSYLKHTRGQLLVASREVKFVVQVLESQRKSMNLGQQVLCDVGQILKDRASRSGFFQVQAELAKHSSARARVTNNQQRKKSILVMDQYYF